MLTSLASEPAFPGRATEDFAAVTDDLVILLDGATSPSGLETGCRHGTRWFARQLGTEVFATLVPDLERDLADALADAIKTLTDRHSSTCDVRHPGHPSATVVLLRETPSAYEYLVLADSTLVIETYDAVSAITDNRLASVGVAQRAAVRAAPPGSPERHAALSDLVTALRDYRNVDGGYWVAATDPDAAHRAILGEVARDAVRSIAALTDGASVLADRFSLLSWPEVADLMRRSGPQELIRLTREHERSDAECQRWPRSKAHDDATAVFCSPEESVA